jgi:hypothetical protein
MLSNFCRQKFSQDLKSMGSDKQNQNLKKSADPVLSKACTNFGYLKHRLRVQAFQSGHFENCQKL